MRAYIHRLLRIWAISSLCVCVYMGYSGCPHTRAHVLIEASHTLGRVIRNPGFPMHLKI